MIFGTQVGVAPGSLALRLNGTMPQDGGELCPPDPVWSYFPSPFEPLTYYGLGPVTTPQPMPPPVWVWPPGSLPPQSVPLPPTPGMPPPPVATISPNPNPKPPVAPAPGHTVEVAPPGPPNTTVYPTPQRPGSSPACVNCRGNVARTLYMPYANDMRLTGRLAGLAAAPGPFNMTWGGFLGVMATAIAGGVGLGYLYYRKR